MKKISILYLVMMACMSIHAQEPQKKKEVKSTSTKQQRAINETGISVKTKPKSKSNAKTTEPNLGSPKNEDSGAEKKNSKKPE